MIRLSIALALLASLAGAEELLIPLRTAPEPALIERTAAFDGYLAGAEQRLHEYLSTRPVKAPAGGGLVGWLSVRVSVWFPKLDGDFRAEGNDIDVSELKLDETEVSVMPEIYLTFGGLGIRFDGFLFEADGRATITRQIVFGGFTFDVDTTVDSRIELNNFRLLGTFPVVKTGPVEILIQGGISVFTFDGELREESIGVASEHATVPIPVLGVLARAKLGPVMVELDATGLVIDYGDVNGSTFDVQASVGWAFMRVVAVRAGYRIIIVDGEAEGTSVNVSLGGFFVGASGTF